MNLLIFNLRVDRHDTALGFTTDWINALAQHFDHVTVITMYRGTVAVAANVEVLSAGLEHGWSKPRRVLAFYRCLFEALRRRRYDCCFAHMMPLFLLLAGPVLKLRGIPAILWYAHNHRPAILAPALAFADRALASTPTAFPMDTPKLRVIGQGIDTERFRPNEERERDRDGVLRVMTVGRISPIKNIDLMIRAFAELRRALPAVTSEFAIVGECLTAKDEAYRQTCVDLASRLGIATSVDWRPPVPFDRVHRTYGEGDIFLSANDNGLDKAILEAMASGLTVVAMHPAVAEPLGRYFARDEDGFAQALIALARLDADARATLAAGLREYVRREHGLERLGARIAGELKELAA